MIQRWTNLEAYPPRRGNGESSLMKGVSFCLGVWIVFVAW